MNGKLKLENKKSENGKLPGNYKFKNWASAKKFNILKIKKSEKQKIYQKCFYLIKNFPKNFPVQLTFQLI